MHLAHCPGDTILVPLLRLADRGKKGVQQQSSSGRGKVVVAVAVDVAAAVAVRVIAAGLWFGIGYY